MEKRRRRTSHPVDLILAGDLGGTKTHLALFRERKKELIPIREQLFPSQKYRNLEEIVLEFLAEDRAPVGRACFGIAGPVIAGRGRITNLPWMVDAVALRAAFGIPSVRLLNDVEATAYGTLALTEEDLITLHRGDPDLWGSRALIAAGTGLGEALLIWNGIRYLPSASEGGHCDFAPRNEMEIRLLEYLLRRFPTVSYERVLSGPGLFNIYRFLKDAGEGEEPRRLADRLAAENPAAVIAEAALAGTDKRCMQALDLFVSIYGAEAGNLALKGMVLGGVYLGGGIAPKIRAKLAEGAFMNAFREKGRLASLMDRITVKVILNEKTGLLGAARFALVYQERAA